MDLRSVFIANIKKYRKEQNLSQMNLAEKVGTSTSYLGEIEIGKKFPSIEMIQKIADALNIPPFKLFMTDLDVYKKCLSKEESEKLLQNISKTVREFTDLNSQPNKF